MSQDTGVTVLNGEKIYLTEDIIRKITNGAEKVKFECKLCTVVKARLDMVKDHVPKQHKNEIEKLVRESESQKNTSSNKKKFTYRDDAIHPGGPPFLCKMCNWGCSKISIIRHHVSIVHADDLVPFYKNP